MQVVHHEPQLEHRTRVRPSRPNEAPRAAADPEPVPPQPPWRGPHETLSERLLARVLLYGYGAVIASGHLVDRLTRGRA